MSTKTMKLYSQDEKSGYRLSTKPSF